MGEWNARNAAANKDKHGVDFADAVTMLENDLAITIADKERFVTIGIDALGRVLVVVYTWRGECVRLISSRFATARERRAYAEEGKF